MKTVTLTNLVQNPLFASGSSWQGYDGVSGGVMYKTSSGWGGFGASSAISDTSGHKYYCAVSVKVSRTDTDVRWGLGTASGGSNVFYAPSFTNKSTTDFLRNSDIVTSSSTRSVYFAYYIPSATSTRIDSNGAIYVDLTAIFGAGNEPDITWCDSFIPFFDGNTTVNMYTENSLIIDGGGHRNTRFVNDDGGYTTVGQNGSGGTITYDGNYIIHTFTSSGTFICPGTGSAEVLVIAGGGGGGNDDWGGGGGGAGGYKYNSNISLQNGSYTVTVGNGGQGCNTSQDSTNGQNSVFSTLTATGGGRGGGDSANGSVNGGSGGSGGGAASGGGIGSGTTGQGYNGGDDIGSTGGGGGGGAGAVGGNAPGQDAGGNGGVGISTYSSLCALAGIGQNISGTYWICGGGGAGGWGAGGTGGNGGGGNATVNGLANSGGGGGGQRADIGTGGNGGSGAVIIRYLVNSLFL